MQQIRNRNPLPIVASVENNRRARGRVRTQDLTAQQNKSRGKVLDLSATGARIAFSKCIMNQHDQIGLTFFWDTVAVPVRASVAWVKQTSRRDIEVGVHFENLNDSEKAAIQKLALLSGAHSMY